MRLSQLLQLLQLAMADSTLSTGHTVGVCAFHEATILQQVLKLTPQLGDFVEPLLLETPSAAPTFGTFPVFIASVLKSVLLQLQPFLVRVEQRDGVTVV